MSDVNTYFAAIADSNGNFFLIDVISSEEHEYDAEITDFPAEEGSDFADNIRNKPIAVTMECLVSNTPLETIARARQQATATKQTLADATNFGVLSAVANGNLDPQPAAPSKPADDCLGHLLAIREARLPVAIITSLKRYESMALQKISIPRATGRGDELKFTAIFKELRVVTNKRYIRVSAPRAMGPKTTNTAPKPTNNNYNDSLPLFNVFFTGGEYLWFDNDIGGWRHGGGHDPPSEANNSSAPRTGSAYSAAAEGWVFFKDLPYGVAATENHRAPLRKYDYEYKNDIANASNKLDPDGSPASVSSNPYDPRTPFGTDGNGNDVSNGDVMTVHGRLMGQTVQPTLTNRHV